MVAAANRGPASGGTERNQVDKSITTRKVELTFASSFSRPVDAIYQGETVKISHVGDAEGMSPVYLVVDSQGQSAWVPQAQVTIIDKNFLPLGQETIDLIAGQQGRGQSAGLASSPAGSTR